MTQSFRGEVHSLFKIIIYNIISHGFRAIKFAKEKASTVHSKLKNSHSAILFKCATKQISIHEIIIETFDYNANENRHLNNEKTPIFENILCPQGINKCKRTPNGFNIRLAVR